MLFVSSKHLEAVEFQVEWKTSREKTGSTIFCSSKLMSLYKDKSTVENKLSFNIYKSFKILVYKNEHISTDQLKF